MDAISDDGDAGQILNEATGAQLDPDEDSQLPIMRHKIQNDHVQLCLDPNEHLSHPIQHETAEDETMHQEDLLHQQMHDVNTVADDAAQNEVACKCKIAILCQKFRTFFKNVVAKELYIRLGPWQHILFKNDFSVHSGVFL